MDVRSVSSCSFVICIALSIGVEFGQFEETTTSHLPIPTVLTELTTRTKFPIIEIAESKVAKNYAIAPSETQDDFSREPDVEGAPPDHIVPYSEHENPEEPSTRSKYTNGNVHQGSVPPEVESDFVPTKLYAQVRKTHTVKRLPREDALKSATNEEEILAAPRLREVVTKSKTNTVYTEEGYEDAAYDHGGHIRDADFQEDYTKKNGDQEDNSELNDIEKERDIKERVKTEELNGYDDDDLINPTKLKGLWQNPSINPKRVTENEIERLEQDLENEYEESEKNAETEVPENLKNPYDSDEEEEIDPRSGVPTDHRNESKVAEKNDEPENASDKFLKDDASKESTKNEIRESFFSKPEEKEFAFTSENPSVDYGKVFWDYFKSVGNNHEPDKFIMPKEIERTTKNSESPSPEVLASVPSFPSVHTTLANFNSDFNFAPSTELSRTITSRMDYSPSAATLYESWKRQDVNEDSEEGPERDPDSSDMYTTNSEEEIQEADDFERNASALNLQNVQGSTTLIGPKKLSYTVIIRPSEKPRTQTCPCDREAHRRPGERTPIVKSLLREPAVSPDEINDFSNANDFTAIEPPLPDVPLRQVTYAGFLPHSYPSLAHPSVTPEIETTHKQINNGERDHYKLGKHSYVNHAQNSHPRYNRLRGHVKNPRHLYPITKLVPPSSINRSKYSDFWNVESVSRPIKKYDTTSNFHPWPEIIRFYRSIERKIFPRQRRSLNEGNNNSSPSHANRIRDDIFAASNVKQLRPKRNLFGESNRLVGADKNATSEKSIGTGRRVRRSSEKLLRETPRIVDEVIDGEIESRFKDDDDTQNEDTEEDDDEKRENIGIEVPDFNFSEVTENNENEQIITKPTVRKVPLDIHKYPYYENSKIPRSSALKYITNPRTVPRKTLGGTEFYDSRDRYRECDEVKPDLDSALPPEKKDEEGEDEDGEQHQENRPRLHGLGDRLDCFRAKYFDDNPLDNPLFLEEKVGQPRLPEELDPKKLNFRIIDLPNVEEYQVARRVSKKPEPIGRRINRTTSRNNQLTRRNENQINRINPENTVRLQESRINEDKRIPRRHRIKKQRLQTTTKGPEILTTPYQHEVYEDVMGTIKNLAGLYETFGEPTHTASSILPEESHALVTPREKKIHFQTIHITERPRGFMVQGLLPPEPTEPSQFQRYRIIPYRTNKVSYRTRLRTENTPGGGGAKLGYFRTVTVHKRSVEDRRKPLDLHRAESRSIAVLPTDDSNDGSVVNNLDSRLKKVKVDKKPAASEKIVYTIRDRIRHSKPRGNFARQKDKYGNLEASASEDVRSQEPRKDGIDRKNVAAGERRSTAGARRVETEDDTEEPMTATKSLTSKGTTSGRHDYLDEPNEMYKIQYSTTHGRQIEPNNLQRRNVEENTEDYDEDENLEEDITKKQHRKINYGDREETEDNHPKGPKSDESTPAEPEFYQLRKYLESDPPGYSEAFDEKSPNSEDQEPEISYKGAETRKEPNDATEEEEEEDDDEENENKEERQIEKPLESLVDEGSSSESSEDNDPSGQLKSHKKTENNGEVEESEEEEDEEETHSPLVEDEAASNAEDSEKEFERFASRPFSPFESYEDSKYMGLGPRLSKPYFYHPSFSTLNYRRKKYSKDRANDGSKESDEKNSKYVFPWDADRSNDEEADGEKSSEESLKLEKYEYPWERRERLARERRRKAKERREHERLYGFSDNEDDEDPEDASGTQLHAKRVYPWEHYKIPSKRTDRKKASRSRITDNEEVSSEHKPQFSSRYKTVNFSDPAATFIEKVTKGEPTKLGKMRNNILRSNKIAEATVTSTYGPLVFSGQPKTATRRKVQTQTTSRTPPIESSFETKRKKRIWPTTTSTTKKPIVRRKPQIDVVAEESLGSGSQKDVVVINPSRSNIRRRRPPMNRSTSSNTSTNNRTFRPRYQKTTQIPQQVNLQDEESTMKSIAMKNTTPKGKTTEHRSRFSKEEIITKTSYPGLNNNNNNSDNNQEGVIKSRKNGDSSDLRDELLNESIRKVSITTKETPEHIYRTEEIDKNGVKGKFISITPNNGTNSSLDMDQTHGHSGLIDHEETEDMLNGFENSGEIYEEQNSGISSMGADSHILANLLMQVRPYNTQRTMFNGEMEILNDFSGLEGSGTIQDDENHDEDDPGIFVPSRYVKDPNQRLYYYIDD